MDNLVYCKHCDEYKIPVEKSISDLCKEAFQTATEKGWYNDPHQIGTILALIHSEVSEALEEIRKGNEEKFAIELADICIRVFSLCGHLDIDLEKAIIYKMEFNNTRPYKHGGKLF